MLCNYLNRPEKLIDEKQIAALAVGQSVVSDLRIANNAFTAALDELKKGGNETRYIAYDPYVFRWALAAVFDAGRVQGIRETRAKRRAKNGKGEE